MSRVRVEVPINTDIEDLVCIECERWIKVGQPYAEVLEGIAGGDPLVLISCVYCASGDL